MFRSKVGMFLTKCLHVPVKSWHDFTKVGMTLTKVGMTLTKVGIV